MFLNAFLFGLDIGITAALALTCLGWRGKGIRIFKAMAILLSAKATLYIGLGAWLTVALVRTGRSATLIVLVALGGVALGVPLWLRLAKSLKLNPVGGRSSIPS